VKSLTNFGKQLSEATRLFKQDFNTSVKYWPNEYNENYDYIKFLRQKISLNPKVLIIGAGFEPNLESILNHTHNYIKAGVHWTNFNPLVSLDILASTHTSPLEASFYGAHKPTHLIHGVYSKVPPCLKSSLTLRWSDPFLLKEFKGSPTAIDINNILISKAVGVAPYIPAVRNTLFFTASALLWLGAKKIIFTAVDPHNPIYFFQNNQTIKLEIATALSMCNPWLAQWDGRNERLGIYKKDTANRIQDFIKNILTTNSHVGRKEYIFEFDRGFKLLREQADLFGCTLNYIGESSYMATSKIKKIN